MKLRTGTIKELQKYVAYKNKQRGFDKETISQASARLPRPRLSLGLAMTLKKFFPYLAWILIWLGFSYPFFFQGKIPAPLDFLVNFYAPWDTYYDFAVKNPGLSDVVSQIIPWKIFNADEIRSGKIPIWNPNNLAGTPQLGSWQSGVLYPTSLLFLLFPVKTAWSFHILLQPLLAGLFTILYLRSLKLSGIASLFGALVFSYGGFMTAWMEWGTLGHAILYLPLALLTVDKLKAKSEKLKVKEKWRIILFFSLALSWLAGHPQMSLYVVTTVSTYYAFRFWSSYRNKFRLLIVILLNCYVAPLLVVAPQVFPGIQTYLGSARDVVDGRSWAKAFLARPYDLLTFLAPDFFGNPVTRNGWGEFSYIEMNGYIGIVALVLALITILVNVIPAYARFDSARRTGIYLNKILYRFRIPSALLGVWNDKACNLSVERFAIIAILICLFLSIDNPISRLIINLRIPIVSSSSPARLMGIISFWLVVLAARGMDDLKSLTKNNQLRKLLLPIGIIGVLLTGMWVWTFISHNSNILIARRNMIWPSLIYFGFVFLFIIRRVLSGRTLLKKSRFGLLVTCCLLLFTVFDLFRFHHKFIPYNNREYWYPEVPVLTELKKLGGRSFGLMEANTNLPFNMATIDGYDPLIQRQYVELTYPKDKLAERNRITGPFLDKGMNETIELISKLGVKWVVQPVIHGGNSWELKLWEYPNQFELVWQDAKYQIFRNLEAAEVQLEPVGYLKRGQSDLYKLGLVISLITLVGVLWKFKIYDSIN